MPSQRFIFGAFGWDPIAKITTVAVKSKDRFWNHVQSRSLRRKKKGMHWMFLWILMAPQLLPTR